MNFRCVGGRFPSHYILQEFLSSAGMTSSTFPKSWRAGGHLISAEWASKINQHRWGTALSFLQKPADMPAPQLYEHRFQSYTQYKTGNAPCHRKTTCPYKVYISQACFSGFHSGGRGWHMEKAPGLIFRCRANLNFNYIFFLFNNFFVNGSSRHSWMLLCGPSVSSVLRY